MHFGPYNNLGNSNDTFKLSGICEDQRQQQQQHQQEQQQLQNHPADATADFFSFADASSDFNHTDPASMDASNYDSHPHSLESAYQLLSFHVDSDPLANHTPLLASHNPDYLISPMLQSTSDIDATPSGLVDDETQEAMYPLMLPANNSAFVYHRHSRGSTGSAAAAMADEHLVISPLTSPALHSVSPTPDHHQNIGTPVQNSLKNNIGNTTNNNTPEDLQQKLALIERQQEHLRNAHRHLHGQSQLSFSLSTQPIPSQTNTTTHTTQAIPSTPPNVHNSPYLSAPSSSARSLFPQRQDHSSSSRDAVVFSTVAASTTDTTTIKAPASAANGKFIAPATPSLLMKLGQRDTSTSTTSINYTDSVASVGSSAAVDNMGSLPAAMLEIKPPIATKKTSSPQSKRRRTSRASAAFTSPGLVPMVSPHFSSSDPTISTLVSPAALRPQIAMSSPRALKPLISPSLKPNGKRLTAYEEEAAATALASKSNYQNMREGKAKSLGIDFASTFQSGVENRRSAHKVAEQKRRDTLKQSFDSLRKEITEALLAEEGHGSDGSSSSSSSSNSSVSSSTSSGGDQPTTTAKTTPTTQDRRDIKEREVKQMSKVVLIQHSYEYILKLKEANRRKDQEMDRLRHQIEALKQRLSGDSKDSQ